MGEFAKDAPPARSASPNVLRNPSSCVSICDFSGLVFRLCIFIHSRRESKAQCVSRSNSIARGGAKWNVPRASRVSDHRHYRTEHLIGSIRSKCLDHLIVFGEAHPRLILKAHFVLQRGPDASVIELKIVQIFGGRRGSATSQRYQS
jgi:hypothetical protein